MIFHSSEGRTTCLKTGLLCPRVGRLALKQVCFVRGSDGLP
ncbi:hypothetical protein SAIN_1798 [Streptococcus anginosus C1051]|nr:hypothetical protein SAIN_1798 [Streptococcus anginosus C1051]AGU84466.1 hypothetical protein SANR_2082 [Streptococcus anginosus C238]